MTQDPKKVTPEQIAELRAALDAHFRVRSPAARERAIDLFFQNHIALLDAAERCALADEHGALALGLAFAQARQDLTAAIARAEAAEKERDEIVSVIIGHDDEDMKHDPKSVAQLVKDVLVERDDLARRLGEAEHSAANFARWFTQAAQHLHIVQPIYLGRAQCDGAVRDAKAYLATLTTPPADGSGEGVVRVATPRRCDVCGANPRTNACDEEACEPATAEEGGSVMPHDWINVHVDGDADARTVVKQCARCRLLAVVHESGTRAAIDYHPQHIRAPQDCPRGDMTEERASETAALRADLTAAIARAEAAEKERDRMRPVVEAAVAEYRAADAANDETEPDDTQVQRNGRWAKAETTLHIAVHNYLDGAHAKGGG